MKVHVTPEMAKKVADLSATTGRAVDQIVEDALEGDLEDLRSLRNTLASRYDDLKSGRKAPISGEDAFTRLRLKMKRDVRDPYEASPPSGVEWSRNGSARLVPVLRR